MNLAIISVTDEGQKLAEIISSYLENDPTVINVDVFHKNVKKTLQQSFRKYDCWVGIMATGIMVRSICPLIESKFNDPAVLVVGENGKHIISLLSGHMGGANHFAVKLAGLIGAIPVITTATDLNGKIGIDTLAYQYWLNIGPSKLTEKSELIKNINQHLAAGGNVDLFLPQQYTFLENHPLISTSYHTKTWGNSFIRASLCGNDLDLSPKRMVAGVGSRKGVTEDQVFLPSVQLFKVFIYLLIG
ncbi:hypothetical protein [Methanobacterium petrolearium]|uniref:hypothetical protein n=1 Tax=Methanobacterium petrolearium TaxID=710190 RepID=UPI00308147CF|nr:hypothetical protein GCM10025861_06270 [Methanobacterium petrolearium]